jgi:branched-chain amino acid transport system permease protein
MAIQLDLLINAIVAGILLGGFYAAVSVGVTIAFGMLDIANISQPAFILLGSYAAYITNLYFGLDPILTGIVMMPLFFVLGMAVYRLYYFAFERRGEQSIQGLAFFFGLLFVGEVSLVLAFGVDYRFVATAYIGPSFHIGIVELPLRMLVPCVFSLIMVGLVQLYLSRSFIGRAILAVSQDRVALQLMAASPIKIKQIAFGISIATCSVAGSFLIIIQQVEPSIGRDYIGRIFAICVLGGMTSMPGMLVAAMLLGIVENITSTFYGPSWSPAVAFGLLLVTLAVRPSGLLGRQ